MKNKRLPAVLGLCVASAYLTVLLEWIFFATGPSFLSSLPWPRRFAVALTAPLLLILVQFALCLLIWLALRSSRPHQRRIVVIVPAIVVTLALFLQADSFAYTLFGKTVLAAEGFGRAACAAAVLVGGYFIVREMMRAIDRLAYSPRANMFIRAMAALFALTLGMAGARAAMTERFSRPPAGRSLSETPDVILIGADGLEAAHLKLSGGPGGAMPHLEAFAREAAVFENAFANANVTSASLASLLCGRTPIALRKIATHEILSGSARFNHLPGILRRAGYHSIQLGMKHYADAHAWNMREAFDLVNADAWTDHSFPRAADWMFRIWNEEMYLQESSIDRLWTRLRYAFGGPRGEETMPLDYLYWSNQSELDRRRVAGLRIALERQDKPVFAHIHLIGTHPGFSDLHPDSPFTDRLRAADERVGEILRALRESGRFDRSLIVFYSDHGQRRDPGCSVPLVIRFPKAPPGLIDLKSNAQNLDIMPTILDYLRLPAPVEVEGVSLLRARDPGRPVFWTGFDDGKRRLVGIGFIDCGESYLLDTASKSIARLSVRDHTRPCPPGEALDDRAARDVILSYAARHGLAL